MPNKKLLLSPSHQNTALQINMVIANTKPVADTKIQSAIEPLEVRRDNAISSGPKRADVHGLL